MGKTAGKLKNYQMWIGGKWVNAGSGKTMPVINPSNEEVIASIQVAGKADVDKAVAAARKALPIWSNKSQAERSRIVNQIAIAIRENGRELANIEMLDHGMPIHTATSFAVQAAASHCEYMSQVSMSVVGDLVPIKPDALTYLTHEPIGVCALIAPWNVPLVIAAEKLAPALVMGNTCIIKPASVDSLSALKLAEIISKLDIPAGAVNIVTGPGTTTGAYLSAHPGIDKVSFTGSYESGRDVMRVASSMVKRVGLELGGKNPFIILEDADIDAVVDGAVYASYFNTGMICGAPGRYYVHSRVHDEFVEKFVAASKKVITGDAADPKTQMGPVVSAEHRDKVEGYINSGIEEGAKLVLGGKRPSKPPLNKGYFVMPTIFINVKQNMRIARDEIFGPVAPILKFSDKDDVLALANDNLYGLVGSVWTRDLAKGLDYARRIHAGWSWVNEHLVKVPNLPWGGVRQSGFGVENSVHGLLEFTQTRVIYAELSEGAHKPWHTL